MVDNHISLSDIPLSQSTNDFGTEGYVQGLVKFISHAATPITIALQGEWGSGKTSLMNRLYNDLCSDGKGFIGITINTWEYSMLASPEETVIKIIGELVHALSKDDPKASSKVEKYMKTAMGVVYRFSREWIKGFMPGAGLLVEASGMPSQLPRDNTADQERVSISDLKNTLSESIKKSMDMQNKDGVIIFVDDLDRLNPPLAVQILELLKNIFTLDNCIFVLAIDYDVVVKGLEPKFGKLCDTNEREFRSFFDKIIQVPFSLPVNNYKPMDFVLDSLVKIGYFTSTERNLSYVKKTIERIVVCSVGKNPRSIKRLINTLSLLDCIGQCSYPNEYSATLEHKIISFAIVAMQVCYNKLYDLLFINPIFDKWDETVLSKLNLHIDEDARKCLNGDIILDAMCEKDVYLNKHHKEILNLFSLIYSNADNIPGSNSEEVIREILDRSSITNVSAITELEELDRKALIYKLHTNVWKYIHSQKPQIEARFRRNTGNGGFYVKLPSEEFIVEFNPSQDEDKKKIHLRIWLQVWNTVPESFRDKPFEEMFESPEITYVLKPLDDTVIRLSNKGIIEGNTWDNKIFPSFIDELKFRKEQLVEYNIFSVDTAYWINLASAADFEDPTIIRAIGDLVISAYELNIRAHELS